MPHVGQTAVYHQPIAEMFYNNHDDHPAIITTVHAPDLVNLKVFFDCGPVQDRTSVHRGEADGGWHEVRDQYARGGEPSPTGTPDEGETEEPDTDTPGETDPEPPPSGTGPGDPSEPE